MPNKSDYKNVKEFNYKLLIALLLFGHGERNKNADLVHVDSSFTVASHSSGGRKRENVFNDCRPGKDTFDKSFGIGLDRIRRQAGIH